MKLHPSAKPCLSLASAVVVILVVQSAAHAAPVTTRFLQAEDATFGGACTKDTNQAGFTGTAFANCPNDTTSYIEWIGVKVQTAGTKRLSFRFANGSGVNRTAEVSINGVVVNAGLPFPATAGWTTWTTATLDANLNAGSNVVRVRGTVAAQGLANMDRLDVAEISEVTPDWGIAMTESTMLRSPTPSSLGSWGYANALRLHGMYRTYQRTGDVRYLNYIKAWVDSVIGANGTIYSTSAQTTVRTLNSLDHIMPGRIVLDVYDNFPQTNYRNALQTIRNRFSQSTNSPNVAGVQPTWSTAYPRTSDQGYWHSTGLGGELWLDGTFMGQIFLQRYGTKFGGADKTYADNEGTQQILIHYNHEKDPVTGLFWHGYDEEGDPPWPMAAGTHHSQEFWCRAMGWYGVILVELLETLDAAHPNRAQVLSILQGLTAAWANYQDPATGRWFQVVNKGSNPSNWTETSCSAMYSYTISKGIQNGWVNSSLATVAQNGYLGVLNKITFGADATRAADLTNITDISEGTDIGNEAYYYARARPVNDNHGLGAFLIMYEHFASATPPPVPNAPSNLVAADGEGQSVLTWSDNSDNEAGFKIERKPQGDPDTSFLEVGQVGANVATTTNVVSAGVYTYRVRAFAGVSNSAYSNTDDATVTAPPTPAAPSNLNATISGGNSAVLTWTDNSSNETGFRIEKKVGAGAWATLTTKAANVTTHTDGSLTPNTYTYRVIATGPPDSGPSNERIVVIVTPVADAHVRDGTSAGTNFGTATAMELKNSTVAGNHRRVFLRFSLAGVTASVGQAKLRVFGASVTTAKLVGVYAVSDVSWGETTITWNNAPAIGAKQGSSLSVGTTAAWTEWDITSYVQAQKAAGATAVTLELKQDVANNETPTSFNSEENAANKPLLVISSN